jgi:peptidyl-prolyl cis-trans isomerase B (cyclophilin B)
MIPRRGLSLVAAVLIAALLGLAGCGGDDDGDDQAASTTDTQAQEGCATGQPRTKRVRQRKAPSFELASDKTYTATVETTCGTFEIRLDSKDAPRTGGSFTSLARRGFYDGLAFHRIVNGYVIQGGDPKGDGTGGPGYKVRERPPDDVVYSEGVVAMAKTGVEPPGTSGSQFFVVTADDANLPPDYALLGEVTKGLDVVHKIEQVPATNERPLAPVVIERITVKAS